MRRKVLLAVVMPLILILVVMREVRLARRLEALAAGTKKAVEDRDAAPARLRRLEAEVDALKVKTEAASTIHLEAALEQALTRVRALEAQLHIWMECGRKAGSSGTPLTWIMFSV